MRLVPLALAAVAILAGPAAAQRRFPPDSFTNLKVLPKNIDPRALIGTMRGFALALGVRCTYCHVAARDDAPLDSVEFAKDDKRTKRVARVMLDMVQHINGEHLAEVPDRPPAKIEVRCATCHRGVARPRLLEDTLSIVLADSGLGAAVRRYRDLRQRYHGSGSYDFRENVINELARGEARAGRTDIAIGLLEMNAEFNPASGLVPFVLGEVYLQKGDTARAVASWRAALAKDSTLGQARDRLRRIEGGASPRP